LNTYTFSLSGLNDANRELVPCQLGIIKPYLTANWVLCSDNEQVDACIVNDASTAAKSAVLTIPLVHELRLLDKGEFDSPLRVLTLLELLNYAESCLSSVPEDIHTSMAEWLSLIAMSGSGDLYFHAGTQTFMCVLNKVLRTNAADKHELVDLIFNSSITDWKKSEDVSILKPSLELPITSLLWSLGLKERTYATQKWNKPDTLYRLLSWPQLGHWESTAPMFRLASLYGRKAASIKTGVLVSGLSEEEVSVFLHACSVSGLKVNTEKEETDSVTQPPINASLSVLQAFKAKLGL